MLSLAELGQGRLEKSVCVKSFFFFIIRMCKLVVQSSDNATDKQVNRCHIETFRLGHSLSTANRLL